LLLLLLLLLQLNAADRGLTAHLVDIAYFPARALYVFFF